MAGPWEARSHRTLVAGPRGIARAGKVDGGGFIEAAGPGAHYDDAVGQRHRLAHIVRADQPAGWKNPIATLQRIEHLLAARGDATERAGLDSGTLAPKEALRLCAPDGLSSGWVLIENEGALFRGPAPSLTGEVWNPRAQAFVLYVGSRKKPVD